MRSTNIGRAVVVVAGILGIAGGIVASAELATADDTPKIAAARDSAVEFLRTTQSADGSWTTNRTPGISGLVIASLLDSGVAPDDPAVQKGLTNLSSFVQADGGIYSP